jgi:hypothetical protein
MDRIELGALWKNENCISGNLGSARLVIFPNSHKGDNEKAPDYHMYLYPGKRQEEWENKKGKERHEQEEPVQKFDF